MLGVIWFVNIFVTWKARNAVVFKQEDGSLRVARGGILVSLKPTVIDSAWTFCNGESIIGILALFVTAQVGIAALARAHGSSNKGVEATAIVRSVSGIEDFVEINFYSISRFSRVTRSEIPRGLIFAASFSSPVQVGCPFYSIAESVKELCICGALSISEYSKNSGLARLSSG
ncbi:hypothetical protein TSUD_258830 [Trifolium subterraneum]|uniref:Uncharacterized protein n=1 Tax=Trifolium subterraneum TaxID=3900 RepID=A0A2Z6MTA8_TRISU|nr:hypothetical protein TSUD_258830 [Trifolium subterraneum]